MGEIIMMGTYYWYIGCSLPKLSPEQPALAVEVKLLAFITDPEELYVTYIYIYTFVGEKHASIRMDSGEQSDMVCIKHETRIVVSILDIWFLNIFVCIYTQIGQFESWSVRFSCWQFFFVIKWRNMWLQYSTGWGEYHASNIMDRHHPGILGHF